MTRTSRLGIAMLVVAFVVAALAPSGAAGAHQKRLIISPRAGKSVPARPLMIRVALSKKATKFRAQLNGHPIARYFSASRHAVRKLQASRTFGLRHGRNRLHVRARRANGKELSRWARFHVRRNRPLAAAGVDVMAPLGGKVYLDSRKSRSHVGSRSALAKRGRHTGLRHSWSVVRAPDGSPPNAGLARAHSRTPAFKPRVAGSYRLRLTVKARDGRTGSDVVSAEIRRRRRPWTRTPGRAATLV